MQSASDDGDGIGMRSSSDDESYNLRMFGIQPALPVPEGPPDWDAGPPDSAEEYLRRVRAEAAALPQVVRVEFDPEAHALPQLRNKRKIDEGKGSERQQGPTSTGVRPAESQHPNHQSSPLPSNNNAPPQGHCSTEGLSPIGSGKLNYKESAPKTFIQKQGGEEGGEEAEEGEASEPGGEESVPGRDWVDGLGGGPLQGAGRGGQAESGQEQTGGEQVGQTGSSGIEVEQGRKKREGGGGVDERKAAQQAGVRQAPYIKRLLAAGQVATAPSWALPSTLWVRQFMVDFKGLRIWVAQASAQLTNRSSSSSLNRLPHINNVAAWDRICSQEHHTHATKQDIIEESLQEPLLVGGGERTEKAAGFLGSGRGRSLGVKMEVGGEWSMEGQETGSQRQLGAGKVQGELGSEGGNLSPGEAADEGQLELGKENILESEGRGEGVQGQAGSTGLEQIPGPLLSTVLCLDQVSVGTLIQRLVTYLHESPACDEVTAQWLFALTAALQKPAHSDVVSAMRALLKKVALLRSQLDCPSDPQLPLLNTLAAVAGGYFGQDPSLVVALQDLELT